MEKTEREKREAAERARWASMSTKDKIAEWTANHQLSVIVGSWALTMGIVGNRVMRDPYVFSTELLCAEAYYRDNSLMSMPNKVRSWFYFAVWNAQLRNDCIACSSASLGSGTYHRCCHRYSSVNALPAGKGCQDEDGGLLLSRQY
jgi:hypothetical protein